MPPLVNVPSPLFLSHSNPPFIYQYIGDQIKIIQVLGNLPLSSNVNQQTNDSDQWDQIDAADNETLAKTEPLDNTAEAAINTEKVIADVIEDTESKDNKDESTNSNKLESATSKEVDSAIDIDTQSNENKTVEYVNDDNQIVQTVKIEEPQETTSLDTSLNENDSAESDDEASFGTPENSPKSRRKPMKGKYGKAKAPPPPQPERPSIGDMKLDEEIMDTAISTTSQESLTDIVNRLPNTAFKESGTFKGLQVVNPIAEKKRRHKAKSPARIPKGHSSGIGKLLQLPSKLAFWNKSDDKSKSDDMSISSEDHSRRSSTAERPATDEFQSCSELNKIDNTETLSKVDIADDQISFKDAADFESEVISQDIIDKSEALEKLIAAKLESHPEYKFVPLHEEIPTTSKSTDV